MTDNREVYEVPRIVSAYRRSAGQGLSFQERFCIDLIPASERGCVLDIGIGAGRTIAGLAATFDRYVGIDYSPAMIEAARSRYPDRDLRVMDARHLTFSERFDCVVFSFNGLDYVGYDDRQTILKRIRDVLRPGGHFVYSTHNLAFREVAAWTQRWWVGELASPLRRLRFLPQRIRNFRRQSLDAERRVGYVNDSAHDFALLTLYVDIPAELERLRALGFDVVTTIGDRKQQEGYDAADNWVYVLARRV
jgi:SAM-dependent methyltransferase